MPSPELATRTDATMPWPSRFVAQAVSFGAFLGLISTAGLVLAGERLEQVVYLLALGAPLAVAAIRHRCDLRRALPAALGAIGINAALELTSFIFGWSPTAWARFAATVASSTACTLAVRRWGPKVLDWLTLFVLVAGILAVFILATPRPGMLPEFFLRPAGLAGAVIMGGLVWLVLSSAPHRWGGWARDDGPAAKIATAVAYGLPFLLLDHSGAFDYDHFLPFTGPAGAMMRGAVPLVDVYSPYGLMPVVIFFAAFKLLGTGYGAPALVISALNALFALIYVHIILSTVRWRLLAATAALVVVLFFAFGHTFNFAITPSHTLLRYFPCVVVMLGAARTSGYRMVSGWAFAAVALAAIWSLEALVLTLTLALALATYRTLSLRQGFKRWGLACVTLLGAALCGWAALAAVFLTVYGRLPDPWPYLDMIAGFRVTKDPGLATVVLEAHSRSFWTLLAKPHYLGWVLFVLAYTPIALEAADHAFHPARTPPDDRFEKFILPSSMFGILILGYFVGRSDPVILAAYMLPMLAASLWSVNRALHSASGARFLMETRAFVIAAAAIMGAVAAGTLAQPFPADRSGDTPLAHSTLLRRCFEGAECTPSRVAARLQRAIDGRPLIDYDAAAYTGGVVQSQVMRDAIALAEAHATHPDVVPLMGRYTAAFLLYTDYRSRLAIGNIQTDQISISVVARVVESIGNVRRGDLVLVVDYEDAFPVEKLIFARLQAVGDLHLVERRGPVSAWRLD